MNQVHKSSSLWVKIPYAVKQNILEFTRETDKYFHRQILSRCLLEIRARKREEFEAMVEEWRIEYIVANLLSREYPRNISYRLTMEKIRGIYRNLREELQEWEITGAFGLPQDQS
jgi:hypothetical protein